jgi:signal transduction histidine kinase
VEVDTVRFAHLQTDDRGEPEAYAALMADGEQSSHARGDPGAGELYTRWMRPLAAATIVTVAVLSARSQPSPSLDGSGLPVLVALIVIAASAIAVVKHPAPEWRVTVATVLLIGGSAALAWTQKGGSGVAGMFVAVSVAAMRLELRRSMLMLAFAVGALAAASVHTDRSAAATLGAELGVVAFYVLASFGRRTQEAHERTAALLAELQQSRAAQEEAAALRERGRIAREIHDVLAHSLSGLMLQLEGARMLARAPNPHGQLPEALDRAHHLARAGLDEARRAIAALRDDDLPGADRLGQLASDFGRDTHIPTTLAVTGTPTPLDPQASLTVFRVAQEALTNAQRHASPARVELRLAYDGAGASLVVEDHRAAGAPTPELSAEQSHGYGLTGMRERAELLGGRLDAGPTGDGFRVQLWVPA